MRLQDALATAAYHIARFASSSASDFLCHQDTKWEN